MAPDLSDVTIEIRNLWKVVHENAESLRGEIRSNVEKIMFINARLVGDHDDSGTIFGRVKMVENKVDDLMNLKHEIEIIASKKNSIFLRVKDVLISVGVIITIILSLKALGVL